jgi:hypothetical protein
LPGCAQPGNRLPLTVRELIKVLPHRNAILSTVLRLVREPKGSVTRAPIRSSEIDSEVGSSSVTARSS